MSSLTTISILLFLLMNIACAPLSLKLFGVGGSSGSQNVENEEEEVEQEDFRVSNCRYDLFLEFKEDTGLGNFLHAFLHLYEQDLTQSQELLQFRYGYYKDLVETITDIDLPALLTPDAFCQENYSDKASSCVETIEAAGCDANASPRECIMHLYRFWKRRVEPYRNAVHGTQYIFDEDLNNAISRVSARFPDLTGDNLFNRLSDHCLLNDYYKENKARSKAVKREYKEKTNYNYYKKQGLSPLSIVQGLKELEQYKNDIYEARERLYGFDIPFRTLFQEYMRRQSLPKIYDDYYAMYLHNGMKNCESLKNVVKFKDLELYCKTYYNLL